MKRFFLLMGIAFLCCGCGKVNTHKKVGVDSTWLVANFGGLTPSVNGFLEDLLIEISNCGEMEFKKVEVSPDELLLGLEMGKYDLVLSTIPMYRFNLAQYDFSEPILPCGDVLVVPRKSLIRKKAQLKDQTVGFVLGSTLPESVEEKLFVKPRSYLTERYLLEGILHREVACGIASVVKVKKMIEDLYSGELEILSPAYSEDAIRFVSKKEQQDAMLQEFNKALSTLRKEKKIEALQRKWGL